MTTVAIDTIYCALLLILTVHQINAFQVSYDLQSKSNEFRILRAEKLRAFINESVDPCFDFYEFACGNWKTLHPATEDTPITSPLKDLEDTINKELQVILEDTVLASDGQFGRKVKDFYMSCMDSESAKQSIKQVFTDFVNKSSGMPAVQINWNERSYNWVTQVSNLRRQFGMDIIIGLNIKPDISNEKIRQIYIGEASTLIPKHICKDGDFTNYQYSELKTEITDNMAYWFDMDKSNGSNFATDLLQFETYVCRWMSEEVDSEVFSNITSLKDLDSMFPRIKFSDFVTNSFGQPINQPIYLQDKGYYDHLSQVVHKTPKRLIANYVMYRALNAISFPEEYNNEKRASLCVKQCMKLFPKFLGEMYNTKNSFTDTKEDVEQIFNNLIQALKIDINSQLWIEETTRKQAIEKIPMMKLRFSNYLPDSIFQKYGSVKIGKRRFWKNVLTLLKLKQRMENEQLYAIFYGDMKTKEEEIISFNINAGYSPIQNIIQMPVSLLRPPVYDQTAPYAYKYGILGYFIARELIHGFDENSLIIDEVIGDMNSWWDLNSTFLYKERVACFRDQYLNYAEDESFLSPFELDKNIKEFITDNGALNISFNAYLQWLQETDDRQILLNETLSNIDYTNTQLFFISFAQNFCTASYSKDEPIFPWDVPSFLAKFKVNGMLWNMKEFSREFNCLPETEMNPNGKCNIY